MEADDEKRTKGRRQEEGEGFRGMTEGEGEGMRIHAGVALSEIQICFESVCSRVLSCFSYIDDEEGKVLSCSLSNG